ncbi:hypothetical protein BDW02DRAFT_643856 [Decorospora gaudefroyi]|uniref:Uncharacterized protein n=1 Tax=Decorospora gaudefroyi TaxID=184978 RepID=A0A6A5KQA4_9PLEO|nr:hypothetical protein BDW02DRAFT_643856 [Decorospora gaudefroyi]
MKESPRRAEAPLRQVEHDPCDTSAERHHYHPFYMDGTHSSYFEDAIQEPRDSGALHGFHDSYQHYANANEFDQSPMPHVGLDAEGSASHAPHPSAQSPPFALRSDNSLLRGVKNGAELPSPSCRTHELRREGPTQAYNMHRRSFSHEGPPFTPMPTLPQPSSRHSSAPPQAAGQHYGQFLGRFQSSQDAKAYRHSRMRFNRTPWRDPESDPTIAEIERHRQMHVKRIYDAMICGNHARDNAKSTALKRWVHEPHYQSDLVEAYAHKVFDCLIEQVKVGFRGWHQNDYVNDERKGEDDDKDIDCAGRLDNIITALEQEKSICENVMSSAWQIRMFVNAPKAYSKRKDQNRVGNSKRPNAKSNEASDDNPRAAKRQRAAPARGRQTRGRSSTVSELPISRGNTPQQPYEPTGLPYFTAPTLQRTAVSPPSTFLAPLAPSMRHDSRPNRGSFGQSQMSAMSPRAQSHTPQPPNIPRITSMPPVHQSAFSPPQLSQTHFSASPTPDDMKPTDMMQPWQQTDTFGGPSYDSFQQMNQGDNSEFSGIVDWQHDVHAYPPYAAHAEANLFEQHPELGVSLADVERLSSNSVDSANGEQNFQPWWQRLGVQQLPDHQMNLDREYGSGNAGN